jgi:CHASE2 domain-containing sensor protein/signal transduction histidine kinase
MRNRQGQPSVPARLYAEWLIVALLATLCVIFLVVEGATDRLDNIFYDHALRANPRPSPDNILIISIDDRSLQEIGSWPWPRYIHAEMLDRLAAAHPRAIGYDVLFVEPSPDDMQLATAIDRARVYLPVLITVPGSDGASFDAVQPVGPLAKAAAAIGHVNIGFDGDRVIRHANLEEGGGRRHWLQLAAMMAGLRLDPIANPADPGLWQSRPVLIPYGGPAGHIRTMSFVDVLRGRVPPELLRDRFILVGAIADGMGDSYPTPTSGKTSQMAGVEIQAHLLDGLISRQIVMPAPRNVILLVSLGILWIMLIGFLWLSPRRNGWLIILLVLLVLTGSYAALRIGRIWFPPTLALLGLFIVYPLWGWRRLEAIGSYMMDELRRLNAEGDAFPQARDPKVVSREITQQASLLRLAIGRLRDLRRFLSDSIGNLPDALFVTDVGGGILLANEQAGRLAALLSTDARPGADIRILLGKVRSADGVLGVTHFDAGGEQGRAEVFTDDGDTFDLRVVLQRDAGDEHVGWIIRIVDVSRLKQAERHREEALQLLSHDMRAPQSAILTLIDDGTISPENAARIGNHARRTLALADDFVQLARAEAKPADYREVDLCDVVIDAADILWPEANACQITIVTEGCDAPELLKGDRQLLTRAAMNLISNAVKYSDAGATVRCILSVPDAGHIRLLVADQGTGMTEEQRANLFRRFRRFRQGSREGIGLGLALVETVVHRHGGTIACESSLGEGTNFIVTLPRSAVV